MAYSIKSVFAGVALCSVAFAVSPHLSAINALYFVLAIGFFAALLLQGPRRRCFVYGTLAGIIFGVISVSMIVWIRYADLPDVPLPLGRGQFDPNATQRPVVVRNAMESAMPYGITVGFVVGGLSGMLSSLAFSKSKNAG